jgi:hypothetical protein
MSLIIKKKSSMSRVTEITNLKLVNYDSLKYISRFVNNIKSLTTLVVESTDEDELTCIFTSDMVNLQHVKIKNVQLVRVNFEMLPNLKSLELKNVVFFDQNLHLKNLKLEKLVLKNVSSHTDSYYYLDENIFDDDGANTKITQGLVVVHPGVPLKEVTIENSMVDYTSILSSPHVQSNLQELSIRGKSLDYNLDNIEGINYHQMSLAQRKALLFDSLETYTSYLTALKKLTLIQLMNEIVLVPTFTSESVEFTVVE